MLLAKFDNGQLITTCADDEDREMITGMVADGFKYFVEAGQPDVTSDQLTEFSSLELRYRDEPHQIVAYYEVIDNSPERITAEITRLQAEISSTDYQVIKSYEYALAGEQLPYNIAELHRQRQNLRDRIKELELK